MSFDAPNTTLPGATLRPAHPNDLAAVEALLTEVGFENADIEPTRTYELEDARAFLASSGLDPDTIGAEISGRFMSAFVRARKPAAKPAAKRACGCADDCCA